MNKKLIILSLLFIVIILVSGCIQKSDEGREDGKTTEETDISGAKVRTTEEIDSSGKVLITEEIDMSGGKVRLNIEKYEIDCTTKYTDMIFYVKNTGTDTAHNIKFYIDNLQQHLVQRSGRLHINPGETIEFEYPSRQYYQCFAWVGHTRNIAVSSDETTIKKDIIFKCTIGTC